MSHSFVPRGQPNEGETAVFPLGDNRTLVLRHGCLTHEPAAAVIVPTNCEFAVSGAADAVLQVVEAQLRHVGNDADVIDQIFHVVRQNPAKRTPGTVLVDGELREAVGPLGGAIISESFATLGIRLTQGWDRIIAGFVRRQARPPDFAETLTSATVRDATRAALRLAARSGARTVATVPFGTGLRSIAPEQSAIDMVPEIADFLRSQEKGDLEKVIVVERSPGVFEQFSSAARRLLGVGRYCL